MPAFEVDDEFRNPLDFQLLQNGHLVLHHRLEVLRRTVASLQVLGYQTVEFDATAWRTTPDVHADIAARLDFPSHYGHHTLAALEDSLSDVATYRDAARSTDTGFALVLTGFDRYAEAEPEDARAVVDILDGTGRRGSLFGHRMLFLLQVDDPDLAVGPVSGTPVARNPEEWARSSRDP